MVPLQGVNIPFLRVLSWQPLGRCCFENISTYHNIKLGIPENYHKICIKISSLIPFSNGSHLMIPNHDQPFRHPHLVGLPVRQSSWLRPPLLTHMNPYDPWITHPPNALFFRQTTLKTKHTYQQCQNHSGDCASWARHTFCPSKQGVLLYIYQSLFFTEKHGNQKHRHKTVHILQ